MTGSRRVSEPAECPSDLTRWQHRRRRRRAAIDRVTSLLFWAIGVGIFVYFFALFDLVRGVFG
jgi:hypothetical protein